MSGTSVGSSGACGMSYVNKVWHGSCNVQSSVCSRAIPNYVNKVWHGSCIEDFNKLHKNFNKFHKMDFSKIGLEAVLRLGCTP